MFEGPTALHSCDLWRLPVQPCVVLARHDRIPGRDAKGFFVYNAGMSPDDPSGWMEKHFSGRHTPEEQERAFYSSAAPTAQPALQTPMQRVPTPTIDPAAKPPQSPPATDAGDAATAAPGRNSPASTRAAPRDVPSPPRQIPAPSPVKDPPAAPPVVPAVADGTTNPTGAARERRCARRPPRDRLLPLAGVS